MLAAAILALRLEFRQQDQLPSLHMRHSPQLMLNGTTTRSPFFSLWFGEPTSTTSPMNSCPSTSPDSIVGICPSIRCRSEPQMAQLDTFRMTSRDVFYFRVRNAIAAYVTFSVPT